MPRRRGRGDDGRRPVCRDALDTAGPAASPCSAALVARTRTPSPGPARRRVGHPAPRRPARRRAAGRAARPAPGDHRRGDAGDALVLLGPNLKEELPVLYLRLRHAAEQRTAELLELGPASTGLTPYAWRSVPVEAGVADGVGAGSPGTRSPTSSLLVRWSSSPAGPTSPSRGRPPQPRCARLLDACPSANVLPALRRGNVVGALQLGLTPTEDGPDATGILTAAAEGRVDLLVLLGADPLADCPGRRSRPARPCRRSPRVAVDTFLTDSAATADVVLAAAAYGEKSGTTTNLEGRVTTIGKKVSVAGTSRPDWMIAAELAERLGPRRPRRQAGVGRRHHRRHRRLRAGIRRCHSRRSACVARRRARRPPPDPTAFPAPWRERPNGSATTIDSWSHAGSMTGRSGRPCRRAWRPSPAPRRPRPPLDLDRVGVGGGTDVRLWPRGAASCCRSSPIRRAPWLDRGPVQRRPAHRRRDHRLRRPAPSTSGWSGCECSATDPLLDGDLLWTPLLIVAAQGARHLRRRPCRHDVHGLVRAQGHRRDAEPHRAQQGRPVRPPADARRRHEAVLQGGPPPRSGRPLRVSAGAIPRLRAGVPRVVGDPARR